MNRRIITAGLVVTGLFISLSANAGLFPVTAGPLAGLAVYDNVLDITWTQDANLSGGDTWDNQTTWAANLTVGGVSGWRLASMSVSGGLPTSSVDSVVDCAVAAELVCRDNELGYMFYQNLNGSAGDNLTGDQTTVGGVTLNNIQSDYWSGSEVTSNSLNAWAFFFFNGGQGNFGKNSVPVAWAVHGGNPGGAVVPVPAAVWLFGSALGLLGWIRHKKA
jgi:hypothetical protein